MSNDLLSICFYLLFVPQTPIRGMWNVVPEDYYVYAVICLVIISLVLIKAAKYMSRTLPTMTRKRKKQLLEQQEFVTTIVKKKKVQKQVKVGVLIRHSTITFHNDYHFPRFSLFL